jgi:hypothetical protein
MATEKSESVTNIEASPITVMDRKKGNLKVVVDQLAVSSGGVGDAADILLFCPIPSNAVILDVQVLNDDLDSHACPTLEGDWGLAYSGIGGLQPKEGRTSGEAIDINCFEDADTALQAAVTAYDSKRFVTDAINDIDLEAWQVGGLTADPGGIFYISFVVGTAAATDAAGDVVVRVDYI